MIVATAGHVDHGKTTLVKGLTGVDTDRLPEEKKRGLSIDLGFAFVTSDYPDLQDTDILGFIDVPGHEKFVRNMIAGVGSVDLALLVIAADDGPMPQTREHLAILQLLGVKKVIVVVTKSDLVDPDRLTVLQREINTLLSLTAFPDALIVQVASNDKRALTTLRDQLFGMAREIRFRDSVGHFRLAIDRSFNVAGAGKVVTGTVMSGTVKIDDTLLLLSSGARLRVRGIHAQNTKVDMATAGQRCALNVAGSELKQSDLKRGDWLTSNEKLQPVTTLDVCLTTAAQLSSLRSAYQPDGLKHWTAAHLHLATASVPCRIALLETELLESGSEGLARLICAQPIGAVFGDRFVLRDQSAQSTIAGGMVIDPCPPRRGRSKAARLELLHALLLPEAVHHSDELPRISSRTALALRIMLEYSPQGIDLRKFTASYNCRNEELQLYCDQLNAVVCEFGGQHWAIAESFFEQITKQLLVSLDTWHEHNPNALGANVDEVSRCLSPRLPLPVLMQLINSMVGHNQLNKKAAVFTVPGWDSRLDDRYEVSWQQLQKLFIDAGDTAPRVLQLAEAMELTSDAVLQLLNTFVAHGRLYRVSGNRYYTPEVLHRLACTGEQLAQSDNFTVAAFRDASGIGRNLVIELLEFFDRSGFTRRLGQKRVVLQAADDIFKG